MFHKVNYCHLIQRYGEDHQYLCHSNLAGLEQVEQKMLYYCSDELVHSWKCCFSSTHLSTAIIWILRQAFWTKQNRDSQTFSNICPIFEFNSLPQYHKVLNFLLHLILYPDEVMCLSCRKRTDNIACWKSVLPPSPLCSPAPRGISLGLFLSHIP